MKMLSWRLAVLILAAAPAISFAARVDNTLTKQQLAQQRAMTQLSSYVERLQKQSVGDQLTVKAADRIQDRLTLLASKANVAAPQLSLGENRVLLAITNIPDDLEPVKPPDDEKPNKPSPPDTDDGNNNNNGGPTAVPAPAALWAGLVLLSGLGAKKMWRRSQRAEV